MKPYYADESVTLHHGDALEVLRALPDASVDAVVTDPPYELGFMGRTWDSSGIAYSVDLWREAYRVLKPGGHLLAFGGTRTVHRLTCAIEDAGFEIRDGIDWLYASGFPKSLDVSKAIDKAAGAEREVVGSGPHASKRPHADQSRQGFAFADDAYVRPAGQDITAPATDDAARWSGWGTALKPSREPIVVARKPLVGTVAANVLAYGTGALNIDATRVGGQPGESWNAGPGGGGFTPESYERGIGRVAPGQGRWPSNVVLSHAPDCGEECLPGCPVAELDRQSGDRKAGSPLVGTEPSRPFKDAYGVMDGRREFVGYADSGGASRFFPVFRYEAKAPTAERPRVDGVAHPTVKPLDLMRWLVRLVTPAGGVVLEPFAGSGTTAEACVLEGFRCIAIERDATYLPLITARLAKPLQPSLVLFGAA